MRIMQVNSSVGWSGGQSQVLTLSRGLAGRGHHVVVVAEPDSELARRAAMCGLRVEMVRMPSEVSPSAVLRLRRLMKDYRIDVVNVHKPLPFSLTAPAASLAKVPVMVVSRRVSFPVGRNLVSRWKWRNYRADGLIAVSASIRNDLIAFGFPPERVEVVYSGTDVSAFHPGYSGERVRAEFGFSADTRVVTKLANYFEWKGYRVFLEAAARVVQAVPFVAFLCVGRRQDFHPEMVRIAQSLGIADRVHFTGFRTDVQEIIAASDITVNCALRGEGLAGVLRESLAMEVPVVASDAGGNAELVIDGVNGYVVPRGDASATAAAILRVLADPTGAKLMARRGRDRVLAEFTADAMIEKTDLFYQRLYARWERGTR
jgi:glycosyltransferase involved in cell wall biosynthesis